MRLHTLDDIRRTVTPAAFEKATRYQRQGRARVTGMAEDGRRIEGQVQGTQRRPYTVSIDIETATDGRARIDGTCSCPVGDNCKHVATLLLESMAMPEGRKLTTKLAIPATGPALSPQAEGWLAELDRALALSDDDYPASIRQRLIYVLSIADAVTGPPVPVLELRSVRLLKNDQFSDRSTSFDPQTAFSGTPAKFLRGNDLPILRLLLSGRGLYGLGGNHTHTLSGETGADIIERVLATGRCRWRSLDGPVMTRGEPRHGTIGWALTEAGTQTCVVSVADGGTAVCLVPPWYLDADAARCGPLHLDVPPRVAATLMQAPAIEPQQVTALRDKLAERLPGETTLFPTEPQPPEIITSPPTPVLQLSRRALGPAYTIYSWASPAAPQDLPVARLTFAYGPVVLSAQDRRDRPVFGRGGRLFQVTRNRRQEARHRSRLAETGLTPITSPYAYRLPADARGELVLDDDDVFAWPRFLVEEAPRLREEGWRIEIEPGFMPPLAEAEGDLDASLHEGSGIDWFEFDVGIAVDGRRINLLPYIVDLLSSVPEDADGDFFDAEDDEPQTLFVSLDDGRLLPLPYARLKPILSALHELFRLDLSANNGRLGFTRNRAAELATLEELLAGTGIAWSGNDALRVLGQRLREVGSIGEQPVPDGFAATLRPYQHQGYSWLQFLAGAGLGGVLADDMGLGKTVQALAHLLAEKQHGRTGRPSLIVAPTSLMANWQIETGRFAPGLTVLTLHGADRKARFDAIPAHDLVLTTFALLPRDQEVLLAQPWHALIVDEAQNVKNPETNAARVLRRIDARQRFCRGSRARPA